MSTVFNTYELPKCNPFGTSIFIFLGKLSTDINNISNGYMDHSKLKNTEMIFITT